MKNLAKYHSLICTFLITLFGLGSCDDGFLDRDNPTATTDDLWWLTQTNLTDYLAVIYNNALPNGALVTAAPAYQANAMIQMSGATDEAVFRANFGSWHQYVTNLLTPQDAYIADLYRNNYANIRDCSRILANYEAVYIADEALKRRFAAEARALRAFAHLRLFLFFGEIPIVDHAIDFADDEATNLPRNTQEEIVSFIISELELAVQDLPEEKYSEADLYRMSKAVCYALEVRLYLHVHDYENVIVAFEKLRALNQFTFYTGAYADIFNYTGLTNSERIWIKPQGNMGVMGRFGPANVQGGQATLSVTANLVDAYETLDGRTLDEMTEEERMLYVQNPVYNNNRDPRLNATVLLPGTDLLTGVSYNPFDVSTGNVTRLGYNSANVSGYLVRKYLTETDRTAAYAGGNLNYIIIRYTEMMLSYVEALVESGQWDHPDVATYLNQIRNRAGLPDYDPAKYNSQETLRTLYRRERFVELALEGTRLFDIRRWETGVESLNGQVYGAWNPTANSRVLVETRTFLENRDYLWPIPQVEINNNAGITQNPNW